MAPAGVSEESSFYPLSHLKIVDRAMQFPVVSDTVGEVSKYADTIRYVLPTKLAAFYCRIYDFILKIIYFVGDYTDC
jgi:hypothetical protein